MFTKELYEDLKIYLEAHLEQNLDCAPVIYYDSAPFNTDTFNKSNKNYMADSDINGSSDSVDSSIKEEQISRVPPSEAAVRIPLHQKAQKTYSQPAMEDELSDFINRSKAPSFSEMLLNYIDKLGTNDTWVYKRAGIDRRHFSKIRSNPDYHPGKNTAIALALALSLDRKETDRLIGAAGYKLSESDKFDLVIAFCLERKIYDLDDVNAALDSFSLKPLAGIS